FLLIVFNQLDVLVNLYVNNYKIQFMDDKNQLVEKICQVQQDIIHYPQILIPVNFYIKYFNINQIIFLLCRSKRSILSKSIIISNINSSLTNKRKTSTTTRQNLMICFSSFYFVYCLFVL